MQRVLVITIGKGMLGIELFQYLLLFFKCTRTMITCHLDESAVDYMANFYFGCPDYEILKISTTPTKSS